MSTKEKQKEQCKMNKTRRGCPSQEHTPAKELAFCNIAGLPLDGTLAHGGTANIRLKTLTKQAVFSTESIYLSSRCSQRQKTLWVDVELPISWHWYCWTCKKS